MAVLKTGYVYIWDKKRQRHNYKHRLVIESLLGRELLPQESIHHLNGCRTDNRIENLLLCKTMKTHSENEVHWGRPISQKLCNLCAKRHHAKGLCNTHYMRLLRLGYKH